MAVEHCEFVVAVGNWISEHIVGSDGFVKKKTFCAFRPDLDDGYDWAKDFWIYGMDLAEHYGWLAPATYSNSNTSIIPPGNVVWIYI